MTAAIAPAAPLGILVSARADRGVLASFLTDLGHAVLTLEPRDGRVPGIEQASLIIVDEASALQFGDLLLAAKERMRPIVMPILVALPPKADGAALLRRGFDELLRLPTRKGDLLARVETFLRLRRHSEEAMRTSEAFSRATLDAIPASICVVDAKGVITLTNSAWRDFAAANGGRPASTCEGSNYAEKCRRGATAADAEIAAPSESILAVLEGRSPSCTIEYPCHGPSERRWFLVSAMRFTAADAPFTVISHTNVTARRESENAARRSELRFRSLIELSSDFYWETDRSHRVTVRTVGTSPASFAAFGGAAVFGKRRWELPSLLPGPEGWEAHQADLRARRPFRDFEVARPREGGQAVHFLLSGEPAFDERGEFLGYRGVGTDVTGRRREERLVAMEHAVTRALSDAEDAASGILALIRAVCAVKRWEAGRHWSLDDRRGVLRNDANWSVTDARIEEFIRRTECIPVSSAETIMADALVTGEPVWVPALERDARTLRPDLVRAAGLRGAIAVPVVAQGKRLGAVVFLGRGMAEPDERLLRTLRAIGGQLGQFLLRREAEAVLRESEARFRGLTTLSSDWYWESDERHRLTRISGSNFPHGVGIPANWQGLPRWEGPGVDACDPIWAEHRAVLDRHEPFQDFEYRIASADGGSRWVSVSGYPESGPDGAFLGYRGVARDVTQRRQAEIVLRESESRFRELTALSSDWYWEMDAQWRITYVSPGFEDKAGAGPGIVLGLAPWETPFAPVGAPWEKRRARLETHAPFRDEEATYVDATGCRRHIVVSGSPVFDDDGAFRGYRGTGKNVTQKRQDDENLRRFRAALDASSDAIYVIEIDTARLVDVNDATCQATGYAREELAGASAALLLEGETAKSVRETLLAILSREGGAETARANHCRKDGASVPVEITRRAFESPQGRYVVCIARDIGERLRQEQALRESNERFRMVARATSDVVRDWNLETGELWWNENYYTVLGFDRASTPPGVASWTDHIHPEDSLRVVNSIHEAIAAGDRTWSGEYRLRLANGEHAHVLDRSLVIHDLSGRAVRMIGAMLDISERKRVEREAELRARRQGMVATFGQFALRRHNSDELVSEAVSVLRTQADVVAHFETTDDGRLVLRRIGGTDDTASVGTSGPLPRDGTERRLLERGTVFRVDASYLQGVEESLPWSTWMRQMGSGAFVPVTHNGHANGILGLFARSAQAIGEETVRFAESIGHVLSTALQRERAEEKLAHLAQFDPLTGLPNRNLVEDRLRQTMAQARRRNWQAAVLVIDLDRFKIVNDTLGRPAGDAVLREAARRIRARVQRAEDTVGRLVGDEFAVVLADLARADDAAAVAQEILDAFAAPIALGDGEPGRGQEVFIGASIGIAVFPNDGGTEEALLRNADMAMARAKQSSRNAYRFFAASMDERTAAKLRMETDLRHALERDEFRLHYQPKVDLRTGALTGAEALLRWQHPQRGLVAPAEFIPLLEDNGLILPVGEWVLAEACAQVRAWQRAGLDPLPVAVNLSAKQFRRGDLHEVVERTLVASGVSPAHLELEITESQIAEDPEDAVRQLKALRQLGLRISVDDFGTGYSSLSYLTRLPITALKVDRSFVRDAAEKPEAASIVDAIISMAQALNLLVIAEGVETEAQAAFLRHRGCDQAQGYLLGRPAAPEELAKRLRKVPN